jgi:hypothetical protein
MTTQNGPNLVLQSNVSECSISEPLRRIWREVQARRSLSRNLLIGTGLLDGLKDDEDPAGAGKSSCCAGWLPVTGYQ